MTADELFSLAVNFASGWSLEDLGFGQTADPVAFKKILAEVYRRIHEVNHLAAERACKIPASPNLASK